MSNECSQSGCRKPPPYTRGMCGMHYTRWKRGASLDKREERRGLCLSERFWQYIDVGDWDACWEWTGSRHKQGYGQFVLYEPSKRNVLAHRMAWEQFWRRPLRQWALHQCNNPPCCNPLHIYDGTPAQNTADSVAAGTYSLLPGGKAVGEAAGNAKLTDQAVRDIRRRYAEGGVSQQQLADEYGVNQTKISDVVRRRTWRHVVG